MPKNIKEEIELIDYIRVVLKKKFWIFWIFILTVLIGLFITLLSPKIYESKAIIRIGKLNGAILENSEELIEVLKEKSALQEIAQLMDIRSPIEKDLEKIENSLCIKTKTRTDIIMISAQERSPKKAQEVVQATANFIIKRHSDISREKNLLLQARINEIENQIKSAEDKSMLLQLKIDQLGQPISEAGAITLRAYLNNQRLTIEAINALKSDLSNAKINLIENRNSALASTPTLPEQKIKPSLKLNLIVAGLLGIFIGLFWIFALEWWQNNKEKLR